MFVFLALFLLWNEKIKLPTQTHLVVSFLSTHILTILFPCSYCFLNIQFECFNDVMGWKNFIHNFYNMTEKIFYSFCYIFFIFYLKIDRPFWKNGDNLVVRQTNPLWSSSNWENIFEQSGAMLLPLYLIFGWQTNISRYVLHHRLDLFSSGIHFYINANIFEPQISLIFFSKIHIATVMEAKNVRKERAIHKKCKLHQMNKITHCFHQKKRRSLKKFSLVVPRIWKHLPLDSYRWRCFVFILCFFVLYLF